VELFERRVVVAALQIRGALSWLPWHIAKSTDLARSRWVTPLMPVGRQGGKERGGEEARRRGGIFCWAQRWKSM
jgi:hypothetical protein